MAEERIVLQDIIYDDGDFKIKKHASLTPKEAIEKMAKGMYLLTNPEDTKYADFYNCYYFELAEAALNALLGEE